VQRSLPTGRQVPVALIYIKILLEIRTTLVYIEILIENKCELQARHSKLVDLRRVELLASAMRKPEDPTSQPVENIATEPEYYI